MLRSPTPFALLILTAGLLAAAIPAQAEIAGETHVYQVDGRTYQGYYARMLAAERTRT